MEILRYKYLNMYFSTVVVLTIFAVSAGLCYLALYFEEHVGKINSERMMT